MARIMESALVRIGEVLDHGERRRVWWDARKRHRPEIFFEMSNERIANSFAEQHASADHHATNGSVGSHAQQESDVRHSSERVHPNGYRVYVHNRHVGSYFCKLVWTHPAGLGLNLIAHAAPWG